MHETGKRIFTTRPSAETRRGGHSRNERCPVGAESESRSQRAELLEVNLRRARVCGSLFAKESPFTIDILDKDGDIIQDFQVEKKAFDYLKRKFKLRVDRDV